MTTLTMTATDHIAEAERLLAASERNGHAAIDDILQAAQVHAMLAVALRLRERVIVDVLT